MIGKIMMNLCVNWYYTTDFELELLENVLDFLLQDGFWSWTMEWLGYLLCGDFRSGDAADHEKIEEIASSFKYWRPVKVTGKSVVLKCKEQILVRSVIWNVGETSHGIFTMTPEI